MTSHGVDLVIPGGISFRGVVFPWECDVMGHLNNKNYLGFFDQAAWHMFLALGYQPSMATNDLVGLADVGQTIAYSRELRAGDLVAIRSYLEGVGRTSLTARHDLFDAVTGDIAAALKSTSVFFDLEKRQAMEIPLAIREAAKRWLL